MSDPHPFKKITQRLRCLLTDDEKIEAGKQLAEANNELKEIEDDKAQVVSDFKAKTTAVEAQVAILGGKLRSGYELRPVECHVLFDQPQPGQKQIIRLDTKETVSTELMTDEEKQKLLPLE